MHYINKYQTIVILLAVIMGILLGHHEIMGDMAAGLIVPLLMVMLFGLFVQLDIGELQSSFSNVRFSLANIAINFLWTPIFAYALGSVFLSHEPVLWIGFVMLMVTPCTDWYLVFTGVAKGNVPLSTSVLPINLLLQVLLLPVYLYVFFGESGGVDLEPLLRGVIIVLVVPFALAMWAKKTIYRETSVGERVVTFVGRSQVLFLALAVMAMFASEGRNMAENPHLIYALLLPVVVFFVATFFIALLVGQALKFGYADRVSLILTTMARNSPVALAIAVAAFPDRPLIALSLVIGPLIELPVLVLTAQMLLRMHRITS